MHMGEAKLARASLVGCSRCGHQACWRQTEHGVDEMLPDIQNLATASPWALLGTASAPGCSRSPSSLEVQDGQNTQPDPAVAAQSGDGCVQDLKPPGSGVYSWAPRSDAAEAGRKWTKTHETLDLHRLVSVGKAIVAVMGHVLRPCSRTLQVLYRSCQVLEEQKKRAPPLPPESWATVQAHSQPYHLATSSLVSPFCLESQLVLQEQIQSCLTCCFL
mmetsp:Transcript_102413/g.181867  ORF Transcript_102413/g.181867 Transcript_102413/m.181867 type:complete len:217 (-) Transcript_102413:357-1007(-)